MSDDPKIDAMAEIHRASARAEIRMDARRAEIVSEISRAAARIELRADEWSDAARAAAAESRKNSGTKTPDGKINRHIVVSKKNGMHEAHFVGTNKHTGVEYRNFVARERSPEALHAAIHANYPAHSNNVTIVNK